MLRDTKLTCLTILQTVIESISKDFLNKTTKSTSTDSSQWLIKTLRSLQTNSSKKRLRKFSREVKIELS